MEENTGRFTWVKTHKGIVEYLKGMESRQKELIELLKEIGIGVAQDRKADGSSFELLQIDPFTFFCHIYKYGDEKKLEHLKKLAEKLKIEIPSDTYGVPSIHAQNVWLFPFLFNRTHNEIGRLWNLFYKVADGKMDEESFQDARKIKGIGRPKLTSVIFIVNPEKYLPINGPVIPYLKEKLGIDPDFDTFSEYEELLNKVQEKENKKPFYEVSFEAWEYTNKKKPPESSNGKKYWLYSPGRNAEKWDEFYSKGIMAIGWEELEDLRKYKDKEEIARKLQEIEGTESSKRNDATANYEFLHEMSAGDVVIVKTGQRKLLGWGAVVSEYEYDESRTNFKSCRKVEWRKKGEWDTDFDMVTKTLTDITRYPTESPGHRYYYERLLATMGENIGTDSTLKTVQFPLNLILYGPPGTGKTYETVRKAAQIIEKRGISDYEEAKRVFNENMHKRIEFITFHQNYCYEDFIQGLRPDVGRSNDLQFIKRDGVFKQIADRALGDSGNNYVIIIDEINRANIARVFGELITLIEPDKRSGGEIPLKCVLPSGDEFIVPSNLYIIGTMNTADKSIALLDIALRRRFVFEAMYPLYEISGRKIHDVEILKKLNEKIIEKKGHDFQIGHSYFMNGKENLVDRMNNKVIPLLLEYFMNDEKAVREILNSAGLLIDENSWPLRVKGK